MLEDAFSERQLLVDAHKARGEYNSLAHEQARQVKETFIRSKAEFLEVTTDKQFIVPITAFFKRRARKMR